MNYDSDDLLAWLRQDLGAEYEMSVLRFQIARLTEQHDRLKAEHDRTAAGVRPYVGSYPLPGEEADRG